MHNSLLIKLNLKMLDLGAELPPLTAEFRDRPGVEGMWLASEFPRFPDLAEGKHSFINPTCLNDLMTIV